MTIKVTITCDGCGKDVSESGPRFSVSIQEMRNGLSLVDHRHFCQESCVHEGMGRWKQLALPPQLVSQ